MALGVTEATEWIEDIKAGIIDDQSFGSIAYSLANPSPRPLPSTASGGEWKLLVPVQRFYVGENGLLLLDMDLGKKQVEKNIWSKEKEDEGKEEKKAEGKAEKEDEGKAEKRGQLCTPKTMQR